MSGHVTAAPPMTQQMNQVAIHQQGVLDPNKYPWLPPGFYHLAAKSPLVFGIRNQNQPIDWN